jgi:hypothetical protein
MNYIIPQKRLVKIVEEYMKNIPEHRGICKKEITYNFKTKEIKIILYINRIYLRAGAISMNNALSNIKNYYSSKLSRLLGYEPEVDWVTGDCTF